MVQASKITKLFLAKGKRQETKERGKKQGVSKVSPAGKKYRTKLIPTASTSIVHTRTLANLFPLHGTLHTDSSGHV